MPNTVVDPTVSAGIPDLSGTKELYLAPSSGVLGAGDLVPSTSGMTYPNRSRDVTDVQLDGGGSMKIPSPGETISEVTLNIYVSQDNAKYQQIEAAYVGKTLMKYNIFTEDGSGWQGAAYVTAIGATSDSGYHYTLTLGIVQIARINKP